MFMETRYPYLEHRPDERTQELFIRGTGVHTSTIRHDRYTSRMTPQQITRNRDLPVAAVLEALAYCQDRWGVICADNDSERAWLEVQGFLLEDFCARQGKGHMLYSCPHQATGWCVPVPCYAANNSGPGEMFLW
jgi:uncharacterized protein (DUF433 family)